MEEVERSADKILVRLLEFERTCQTAFVEDIHVAFTRHPLLLESAARAYGSCFLQLHYWAKWTAKELSAKDLEPAKAFLTEKKRAFMQLSPSDDFCLKLGNLVHAHWLGATGRVPVSPPDSASVPLSSLVQEVLPSALGKQLHKDIKTLCKFKGEDNKVECGRAATCLLDILIFAYSFEQEHNFRKWFERYFISAMDFPRQHHLLENPKRHMEPRRPIIFPLLGQWAIATHDKHLYLAPTGFDAVCTWLTLLRLYYHDCLEGMS